jgi:beta-glucosidase-like glycosyl hydrolase
MKALDQYQILPVMKHFPGIGRLSTPLTEKFSVITPTKNDLLPFKEVLDQANEDLPYRAVLVSLVGVKQSGGTACALTKTCVDQVVNAYDRAIVVSDDLTQKSALYDVDKKDYTKTLSQVAYEALMAGDNIIYFGETVSYDELDRVLTELVKKYQSDEAFQIQVETSKMMVDGFRSQYEEHYGL